MESTVNTDPFARYGEEARVETLASTLALCMCGMHLVRIRQIAEEHLELNGHRVTPETIHAFITRGWVFRVRQGSHRGIQVTREGLAIMRERRSLFAKIPQESDADPNR